jgi:hypothetical protein
VAGTTTVILIERNRDASCATEALHPTTTAAAFPICAEGRAWRGISASKMRKSAQTAFVTIHMSLVQA